MKNNSCIAFTGGGTAGHVFPGLAVAEILKNSTVKRMFWIGSRDKREKMWFERTEFKYYGIYCGKWRRYFSFKNFIDFLKILTGFIQAFICLLKEKPEILFSKGGFVSVTPVLAARLLGIPVFTHESDIDPGMATKINSFSAFKILTSFECTVKYFKDKSKVVFTGNPVRMNILNGNPEKGREIVGCRDNKPVILVLGGSLGAKSLNKLIISIISELTNRYFVVHQMGNDNYIKSNIEGYYTAPFFTRELPHVFACSDLIICRAGANTLSELAALGKPAVLVPLSSNYSRGDQIRNASFFRDGGAAEIFIENKNSEKELLELIKQLLDNSEKLKIMKEKMQMLAVPDAALNIAELIRKRIE